MTNQWVCMTSTSEHSFIVDLARLSTSMFPLLYVCADGRYDYGSA
jgi:hypothetical protein